jgi:Uma2 family endonuclease
MPAPVLPGWLDLPPGGLTAEDYEDLPEDICRHIEVVDGNVIVTASRRIPHQDLARRLGYEIEQALRGTRWRVAMDVDLRLREVPLLNRRPDLVVYDGAVDRSQVLRAEAVLLVTEIMSPGSITTDRKDKPAEYAEARIPHFWRIELDADDAPAAFRYRLDPTTGVYVATDTTGTSKISVTVPFAFTVELADLTW